jgi:hypothetical protein
LSVTISQVLAEAFFLPFALDEANEKLAADYETVVALGQVASKIKVRMQDWRPPIQPSTSSCTHLDQGQGWYGMVTTQITTQMHQYDTLGNQPPGSKREAASRTRRWAVERRQFTCGNRHSTNYLGSRVSGVSVGISTPLR